MHANAEVVYDDYHALFFCKKRTFLFSILTQIGAYLVGCYLGFPQTTIHDWKQRQKLEINLSGQKESGIIIVVIVLDYFLRGLSRTKLG